MIEKNEPKILIQEESFFTTIINETIFAIKDPGALGIYCYLASKPPSWIINKQELMNHFGVGRDYINARWKYLREIGLLDVIPQKNVQGQFESWVTILKRRIPEKQNTDNPLSGTETTIRETRIQVLPPCGESAPINTIDIQIQEGLEIQEVKKEKINKKEKESELRKSFEEVFAFYPNDSVPERAFAAWKKINPSPELIATILQDIIQRKEVHDKWQDLQYVPYFSKYLKEAHWRTIPIFNAGAARTRKSEELRIKNQQFIDNKAKESQLEADKHRQLGKDAVIMRNLRKKVMTEDEQKKGISRVQILKQQLGINNG